MRRDDIHAGILAGVYQRRNVHALIHIE
jgi:hypothetical protein